MHRAEIYYCLVMVDAWEGEKAEGQIQFQVWNPYNCTALYIDDSLSFKAPPDVQG